MSATRVLAIDPGERRVGVAVSDALGITAQGLPTFDRRQGDLLDHLRRLQEAYGFTHVVVGLPVSMSGRESAASHAARALAGEIGEALGVTVDLWDERLSSAEANRLLAGAKAAKGAVDRVAAALILQGWLDAHPARDR